MHACLPMPGTKYVLVVDGDECVVRAIARNLRLARVPVVTALCGEEALLALANRRIAVIISDSLTHPVTGIELFRKAKKNCPNIVTILLSGQSKLDDVRVARIEGILHAFVPKPWDTDDLLHLVHTALDSFICSDCRFEGVSSCTYSLPGIG
jgi:DNA-binding NtrC family response regulator